MCWCFNLLTSRSSSCPLFKFECSKIENLHFRFVQAKQSIFILISMYSISKRYILKKMHHYNLTWHQLTRIVMHVIFQPRLLWIELTILDCFDLLEATTCLSLGRVNISDQVFGIFPLRWNMLLLLMVSFHLILFNCNGSPF